MSIFLEALKKGESAEVVKLEGGFGLQQHLSSLGISPGKIIRKVTVSRGRGLVMIEMEGNRVVIGKGIASKVIVTPIRKFRRGFKHLPNQ